MNAMHIPRSTAAAFPLSLRLWALPLLTLVLITGDIFWVGMNNIQLTMAAAVAIVVTGIPHGTLDAEIAAARFGHSDRFGKIRIITAYLACVLAMIYLWAVAPAVALVSFLIISIVHFSRDWRGGVDPFLAMMVGWGLISLPALSHPQEVAAIFNILTGNENGATISALLACTSVPAILGSMVFAYWAYTNDDMQSAVDVSTCLLAAFFLPPLAAFAVFFCGLHAPRHMADALHETGMISDRKKLIIIAAVFFLSLGLGVLLYASNKTAGFDTGVIRSAFVLISVLTVPHFILEHMTDIWRRHQA
jgi:beta-carotene 15,15'-dioxygenase